jgi:hypothetical protein
MAAFVQGDPLEPSSPPHRVCAVLEYGEEDVDEVMRVDGHRGFNDAWEELERASLPELRGAHLQEQLNGSSGDLHVTVDHRALRHTLTGCADETAHELVDAVKSPSKITSRTRANLTGSSIQVCV